MSRARLAFPPLCPIVSPSPEDSPCALAFCLVPGAASGVPFARSLDELTDRVLVLQDVNQVFDRGIASRVGARFNAVAQQLIEAVAQLFPTDQIFLYEYLAYTRHNGCLPPKHCGYSFVGHGFLAYQTLGPDRSYDFVVWVGVRNESRACGCAMIGVRLLGSITRII
jgi:hypothetical protein